MVFIYYHPQDHINGCTQEKYCERLFLPEWVHHYQTEGKKFPF